MSSSGGSLEQPFGLGLGGELLELGLEGIVLGALALEEARCDAGLGFDAF
jgi:hypothetical protein